MGLVIAACRILEVLHNRSYVENLPVGRGALRTSNGSSGIGAPDKVVTSMVDEIGCRLSSGNELQTSVVLDLRLQHGLRLGPEVVAAVDLYRMGEYGHGTDAKDDHDRARDYYLYQGETILLLYPLHPHGSSYGSDTLLLIPVPVPILVTFALTNDGIDELPGSRLTVPVGVTKTMLESLDDGDCGHVPLQTRN